MTRYRPFGVLLFLPVLTRDSITNRQSSYALRHWVDLSISTRFEPELAGKGVDALPLAPSKKASSRLRARSFMVMIFEALVAV